MVSGHNGLSDQSLRICSCVVTCDDSCRVFAIAAEVSVAGKRIPLVPQYNHRAWTNLAVSVSLRVSELLFSASKGVLVIEARSPCFPGCGRLPGLELWLANVSRYTVQVLTRMANAPGKPTVETAKRVFEVR